MKILSLKDATRRELQESKTAEIKNVTQGGNKPDSKTENKMQQGDKPDFKKRPFQKSCRNCNGKHLLKRGPAQPPNLGMAHEAHDT